MNGNIRAAQAQTMGNIVHRRMIECTQIEDNTEVDAMLSKLSTFDWVVFTSVNGATYLFKRMREAGFDMRVFGKTKVAAIGKSTAELIDCGLLMPR